MGSRWTSLAAIGLVPFDLTNPSVPYFFVTIKRATLGLGGGHIVASDLGEALTGNVPDLGVPYSVSTLPNKGRAQHDQPSV